MSVRKKPQKEVHNIYFGQLSLSDGFAILGKNKHDRLYKGKEISAPSGLGLFQSLQNGKITCYCCNAVADRWVIAKGKNDEKSKPVMNLYATKADMTLVMMNRDHIIPRSVGGVDSIENLRAACEDCNTARGNYLTDEDVQFIETNLHLVNPQQLADSLLIAKKAADMSSSVEEYDRILQPYNKLDLLDLLD